MLTTRDQIFNLITRGHSIVKYLSSIANRIAVKTLFLMSLLQWEGIGTRIKVNLNLNGAISMTLSGP